MARLTKQEMLVEEYRERQRNKGAVEVVSADRYEYSLAGKPYLVMEVKPGILAFDVLVLGGMAPKVAAFKSKRMAYVPIEGRENWYHIEVKADRRDLLEATLSAVIGSTCGELEGT
ncbi:MAG: hypothetical protein KIT72_01955 [Polyangiaceae bacterium]|nr:hypothetical protein [Polyangiaceae bacterium]MCW5789162.1 hypothetical protein [Polyangiaceae bacterium]